MEMERVKEKRMAKGVKRAKIVGRVKNAYK